MLYTPISNHLKKMKKFNLLLKNQTIVQYCIEHIYDQTRPESVIKHKRKRTSFVAYTTFYLIFYAFQQS